MVESKCLELHRHAFVDDAFPLEIDQYGASAWTAQALPALR
jgi:hypothetical protein